MGPTLVGNSAVSFSKGQSICVIWLYAQIVGQCCASCVHISYMVHTYITLNFSDL